jgi:hypothetical protein
MNDKWAKDGKRWHIRERDRVAERFRSHVRTPSNPKGRIVRENCTLCAKENKEKRGEAHHPDYNYPFKVAWLCFGHHRKVDHGALALTERDFWDYTSLVAPLLKPRLEGNRNALKDAKVDIELEAEFDKQVAGVPF